MSLVWLFYFAGVTDNLAVMCGVVAAVLSSVLILMVEEDYGTKIFKGGIISSIIPLLLLCVLLPSSDTVYKMAAAYGVETVAANPNVQRLAGKSLEVIENSLDAYLKDKPKDK